MIKNRLRWVVAVLLLFSATHSFAQQSRKTYTMTLDECLEYARENSIVLKQFELSVDDRIADELSAKGAFLPNVSASAGESLSSNPIAKNASNDAVFRGTYALNLSMSLYKGGINRANLKQSQLGSQIAQLSLAEQENSIEVAITEVYVQILYAMEQIKVSEQVSWCERALSAGRRCWRWYINIADFS